jgi:hypothetical protein
MRGVAHLGAQGARQAFNQWDIDSAELFALEVVYVHRVLTVVQRVDERENYCLSDLAIAPRCDAIKDIFEDQLIAYQRVARVKQ